MLKGRRCGCTPEEESTSRAQGVSGWAGLKAPLVEAALAEDGREVGFEPNGCELPSNSRQQGGRQRALGGQTATRAQVASLSDTIRWCPPWRMQRSVQTSKAEGLRPSANQTQNQEKAKAATAA